LQRDNTKETIRSASKELEIVAWDIFTKKDGEAIINFAFNFSHIMCAVFPLIYVSLVLMLRMM
jgi:hypothetical protein